jgi:hypothetical protein
MKTLAALYCEQRHVRPEDFERHVLDVCLYPWARRLRYFLSLRPGYFEPDLELIRAVGRLTSTTGFSAEVAEYQCHPGNSGRLRRELKLRASVARLQNLMFATLSVPGATVASMTPFDPAKSTAQGNTTTPRSVAR